MMLCTDGHATVVTTLPDSQATFGATGSVQRQNRERRQRDLHFISNLQPWSIDCAFEARYENVLCGTVESLTRDPGSDGQSFIRTGEIDFRDNSTRQVNAVVRRSAIQGQAHIFWAKDQIHRLAVDKLCRSLRHRKQRNPNLHLVIPYYGGQQIG